MEPLVELISRVHGLDRAKARPLARSMLRTTAVRTELGLAEGVPSYAAVRRVLKRYYFDQLPVGTQADLTHNFSKKVPHAVITCAATILGEHARNLDQNIHYTAGAAGSIDEPSFPRGEYGWVIGGSYRRGLPRSNDIDLMVVGASGADARARWHVVVDAVNQTAERAPASARCVLRITAPYQGGESREECVFLITLRRQTAAGPQNRTFRVKADIFFTSSAAAAYMLLYITGSFTMNIRMRARAKQQGMLLNQYGLFPARGEGERSPDGPSLPASRERRIFEHLGLAWHAPTDRE